MGQRAYEAFEKANGFSPCVEWHSLPLYRRNAWIDAAAAAVGEDQMQREAQRIRRSGSFGNTPPPVGMQLDAGIRDAVMRLRENGIETVESCEGGEGHAYPEPTIAFRGPPEAGWRALSLCFTYGLPVKQLRRIWDVLDGTEPTARIGRSCSKRRQRSHGNALAPPSHRVRTLEPDSRCYRLVGADLEWYERTMAALTSGDASAITH